MRAHALEPNHSTDSIPQRRPFGMQEEVEQAELEQAIAMSLALEAARADFGTQQEGDTGHGNGSGGHSAGSMNGEMCDEDYDGPRVGVAHLEVGKRLKGVYPST